jgi:hypothetical protein
MRLKLIVIVSFLLGISAAIVALKGGSFFSTTISVNAADVTTHQEGEMSFGPEDLLKEAEVYDQHADQIEDEVMQYHRTAASITPLMDPKGFRRAGLLTAASSKSKAVAELRELAAHHRTEAKRMIAKHSAPQ